MWGVVRDHLISKSSPGLIDAKVWEPLWQRPTLSQAVPTTNGSALPHTPHLVQYLLLFKRLTGLKEQTAVNRTLMGWILLSPTELGMH